MKAVRVDIKKTDVELSDGYPYLRLAVLPHKEIDADSFFNLTKGFYHPLENVTFKTYHLREVSTPRPTPIDPFARVRESFLVEENDKKLFDKLVAITDGDIQSLIYTAKREQDYETRKQIKSIVWWRRLFKRF